MNPLKRIRKQLGPPSQQEFAGKLGISQQSLSRWERELVLSGGARAALKKAFEEAELAPFLAEPPLDRLSPADLEESEEEAELAPPEVGIAPEVIPWMHSFRTRQLMMQVRHHARHAGMAFELHGPNVAGLQRGKAQKGPLLDDLLFPIAAQSGLDFPMLLSLGSPYRCNLSQRLFEVLGRAFKTELHFLQGERPFEWFGFPSRYQHLQVGEQIFRSSRYLTAQKAVIYEDHGVFLYAPFKQISTSELSFSVDKAVLISGNHRLAGGIGCRLLLDKGLRAQLFPQHAGLEGLGGFVFRVRLVCEEGESRVGEIKVVQELGAANQR
jgi:transcriptional regulator with XRE-family HTH domain